MKNYKVQIDIDALNDIQEATDWYNMQSLGLGLRFQNQVKEQISGLSKKASSFSIRYSNVRCMAIKKFPFLTHFIIDEINKNVIVFAVFHTSRNPEVWKKRTNT